MSGPGAIVTRRRGETAPSQPQELCLKDVRITTKVCFDHSASSCLLSTPLTPTAPPTRWDYIPHFTDGRTKAREVKY